ncbi:phage portal protein [Levilactobacillus spicheri]|uniref:Phage portal protein n=2 Tax=Levilactobacillus spicheri TaxID=216463 RepID=A0ABQ0WQJ4_9LACO|nr:phage portal protein [Levilactobacillus spicheri]GEO67316.1 phage portal protein [Levilactobacillus spicheri]
MAETNDPQAHGMSLPWPDRNSKSMLHGGSRFGFDANQEYQMPADTWNAIKANPDAIKPLLAWFVGDHYRNQLPRLLTLERYYQADNDIHFWHSDKAPDRADNRITSGLPRYITDQKVGYQFGNPLKFAYSDPHKPDDSGDDIVNAIAAFNDAVDEPYHEKVMGKNLNNTGRAYELTYVKQDSNDLALRAIDPAHCFVVYDTTIDLNSLFAVRYYMVKFMETTTYYVEVYTDSMTYYYTSSDSPNGEYTLTGQSPHFFGTVPITEYRLNDERLGAWEPKLDEIDAYDRSVSEMANSQEDFNNAILVISGDVDDEDDIDNAVPLTDADGEQVTDDEGHPIYKADSIDPKKRVLFVKATVIDNPNGGTTVIPTTASYLTKELNAKGWQTYNDRLLADIHKDTNTPDVTDQNFAANASGVAMSYKLWGSDQERATQQSLYTRGIKRRIRLLATYWAKTSLISSTDEAEHVNPSYTPNLPKNDNEVITNAVALLGSGQLSNKTFWSMIESATGVKPDGEEKLMKDQKAQEKQEGLDYMNKVGGSDQDKANQFGRPGGSQLGDGSVDDGQDDSDGRPGEAKNQPADKLGQKV